jgi:hypothetical protein
MTSSVVQASDLQIYASPTAGKKTIVMMLDKATELEQMAYHKLFGLKFFNFSFTIFPVMNLVP